MPLLPTSSRSQLSWHRFVQEEDRGWCLVLPPFYAQLFELHFPALLEWPYKGFRDSHSAQTRIARFQKLLAKDRTNIQAFLDHYSRIVILGKNDYIKADFADELDHCRALDYNKPKPGPEYTEIGELEYRAKYQRDEHAIEELVGHLVQAAKRVPRQLMPKPRLLTYVPSDPSRDFCLPETLAKAVVEKINASFWGMPDALVVPALKEAKKSAKNVSIKEKLALWRSVVQKRGIKLSRSVKGQSVLVIDDLYQSGASLWSFAKYLKNIGATTVVGLVCVKSLRDKDNK